MNDEFIDKMRDEVILNWPDVQDKRTLLADMFHSNPPIPFWVIDYDKKGYSIETEPDTIDESQADNVEVMKYRSCYVAFVLNNRIIAKVQVKFNNGFIESLYNKKGEAKRKRGSDFIEDGLEFIKGEPFGSWDFTLVNKQY